MKIRPFQTTDADYKAIIAIHNLLQPARQYTISFLRQEDEDFASSYQFTRVIGEVEDRVIAHGVYWHSNSANSEPHQFSLFVHPDFQESDVPSQLQTYLLSKIEAMQPTAIASEPKEDERYRVKLLEEANFELTMRFPRSQLDVNKFDTAVYEHLFTNLKQKGIECVTLTEVIRQDEDWQKHIWQLFNIINQDVPYLDPNQGTPFVEYAKYYEGENFRPDSWAIAIDIKKTDATRYVGMSVVNHMQTRPDALFAGITGVIPSYRRRKIATALKVSTVQYAQKNDFLYIETDNEENNPMYTLNLQLGYESLPAWVYYKKQIQP